MKRIFALTVVVVMVTILMVIVLNQKEEPEETIIFGDSTGSLEIMPDSLFISDTPAIFCEEYVYPEYICPLHGNIQGNTLWVVRSGEDVIFCGECFIEFLDKNIQRVKRKESK